MNNDFTNDDWLTPLELLRKFGAFDLDPAMPIVQPWQTAARCYTQIDNGLVQPWHGRVWLNPPYSDMEAWIQKLVAHVQANGSGMGLYNARTETKWFFDGIWKLADAVFFPKSRFKFVRPDGKVAGIGKMGSVIAAYSEADASALYAANLDGKFIALRFKFGVEIKTTWRRVVRSVMRGLGGTCTLEQLYELVSQNPKAATNPNWKAKVRQVVQSEGTRLDAGTWQLSAA